MAVPPGYSQFQFEAFFVLVALYPAVLTIATILFLLLLKGTNIKKFYFFINLAFMMFLRVSPFSVLYRAPL